MFTKPPSGIIRARVEHEIVLSISREICPLAVIRTFLELRIPIFYLVYHTVTHISLWFFVFDKLNLKGRSSTEFFF